MRLSFKSRLYIGFVLAILLSGLSGITSYLIFQKQGTQRLWVRRTHHVIDSAKAIQNMVVDMETGRRGFRATNQKRFLEPYLATLPKIGPTMQGLKDSLADNPEDENKASLLEQRVHALMQFWENNGDDASKYFSESGVTVASIAPMNGDSALITKVTDAEKKQVDSIRAIVAGLEKDENKLLAKRRDEYELLIHDGTLSSSLGSVLSEAIIIILIYFIFREFNRRRKIQDQLNKTVHTLELQKEELITSEEELKSTLSVVENINKQLEKYAYTVAHDIKSPLAGISGSLSILELDDTVAANPELSEFIKLSAERVEHLSVMVNSILEYSRLSLDKQHTELVDTKKIVADIIAIMYPPANIKITVNGAMPVFKTKKIKITEVFQNLVSNAIKYNNKEEGIIAIGCIEKNDYYQFYVKDNGFGIPEENLPRIFSLFRDTTHKPLRESSTGFGLNIVKLIVEEQGGTIWAESVAGQGSTFYFQWRK